MRRLPTSLRTVVAVAAAVLIFILATAVDSVSTEHVVEIRNLQFTPKELNVAPGDTITWINYDFVPHTVTADNRSWDSGLIEANGKWELLVKEDTFKSYFCIYHPTMKGGLNITK